MVKRSVEKAQQEKVVLATNEDEAEKLINERVKLGEGLLVIAINNKDELDSARAKYYEWDSYNTELLKLIFSNNELSKEYSENMVFGMNMSGTITEDITYFKREIQMSIDKITSIRARLVLYSSSFGKAEKALTNDEAKSNNKVFIVHGHDNGLKETVARLVEKLSLEAIILHEKANGGKTIIEKLEANSDVSFAIVLLTADDVGKAKDEDTLKDRARQNVIAELGYFVGKLGRNKVCPLYVKGVEMPTDFTGVSYVEYDTGGGWKYTLGRELKEAGLTVDLNEI